LRFLFLANRIPYPPYRGDKLKIYHLAKRLAARHELHLVTFTETEEDKSYVHELRTIFSEVDAVHLPKWRAALNAATAAAAADLPLQVAYFQDRRMRTRLSQILSRRRFDAAHVQHLRMAPYLAAERRVPRILDLPDAFSLYWQRRAEALSSGPKKIFTEVEAARVLRYEGRILPQYDKVLACSSEDVAHLQTAHGATNLAILPNGVDLAAFDALPPHDYNPARVLLFTGNMDYAPNVDAVVYFAKEVLPIIRAQHPDVRFVIAGQRPVPRVQDLVEDGAEITGFVEKMAAVYRQAAVVVAPLRFGAGTQNKVLEGMAAGVPVVCTRVGFAGLGVASGEGAVLAEDGATFAGEVLRLLASSALRQEVGEAGAAAVRARLGWDAVAARLEDYFGAVINGSPAGVPG